VPGEEWWLGTGRAALHEGLLAYAMWRLAGRLPGSGAERWAAVLVGWLIFPSLVGQVFAFLGWHAIGGYLGVALLLAAVSWRWGGRGPGVSWQGALAAVIPLALFLMPVREVDSLYNLHYVLGWLDEGRNPYHFAFHYVPFFELGTLPGLALAGHDGLLWVQGAKAIGLLGAALWMLAEEFGLDRKLRLLAVSQALLLLHLWWNYSGISTIKNDMAAAAGQALLALVLVRAARIRRAGGEMGAWERAAAVVGAILVCTKFSGPILLAVWAPLAWLAGRQSWLAGRRMAWAWWTGGAAAWLATVGHYYTKNVWEHGNPVYPFAMKLGPLRLPGLADQSHTSLLYSWREPAVWKSFFWPEGGVSPMGVLFPLAWGALAALVVWRLARWKNPEFPLFYGAALFVYLRSIYSASGQIGDLQFVRNDLNSLRYFEGTYLTGELWLAGMLAGWPRIAAGMLAVSGLSRVWVLAVRMSGEPGPEWALLALGCTLLGAGVLLAARWGLPFLALAGALGGAAAVEARRPGWLIDWQAMVAPLYKAVPSTVYVVVDDPYSPQPCLHLAAKGGEFRHKVRLGKATGAGGEDYVIWLRGQGGVPHLRGYQMVGESTAGALWRRAETQQ
jgi:hypothetical protein